jgi:hypothetical protein
VIRKKEIRLFADLQLIKESRLFGNIEGGAGAMHNGFGFHSGIIISSEAKENIWLNTVIGLFSSNNKFYFIGLGLYIIDFVKIDFRIIEIPVGLGFDLTRWLKKNNGIILDYHYNKSVWEYFSNQPGMGVYFAPDFYHNISDQFRLSITPTINHLAIMSLSNDVFKDRILSYGISLGITHKL